MNFTKHILFVVFTSLMALAALLIGGARVASAQPTIVSTVPVNMASGVSPSADVVLTFSEPMDTANTSVEFLTLASTLPTTQSWSVGNTVLTCTPTPAFPAETNIIWSVTGQNVAGMPLSGSTGGFFSTGSGSGSGTNAITSFNIGKSYLYEQLSAGAPTPPTTPAYSFIAATGLSSNRTANTITLTLPSLAVSNLVQNFLQHEDYLFFASDTNNARFESTFPEGNYVFNVTASSSNQTVNVSLPTSMAQPNAPHISNFALAQSVNATNPFTLTWDPFVGGTASDFILLTVGNRVFQSPTPGMSNVLNGTAVSVTIPANKLAANSNYVSQLLFFHTVGTSNATYATAAYRASVTQFNLKTTGAGSTVPVVSKPVWGAGGFRFDVATSPGQVLKVLFSTDCSLPVAQWQLLQTTTSTGTSVHITVPPQPGATGFFRIQNGP